MVIEVMEEAVAVKSNLQIKVRLRYFLPQTKSMFEAGYVITNLGSAMRSLEQKQTHDTYSQK